MRGSNDPFEQMEEMFEQMRRAAFGSWADQGRRFPNGFERFGPGRPQLALPDQRTRDAGVTLEKSDDGYVVFADLPGFEREEIDLTFDHGVLTIDGTHEVTDDEEYRQRTVSESVRIPGEVVMDEVTATYQNGVLEVTLPVEEESRDEYRIDIE